MITVMEKSTSGMLAVHATGKLTDDDYKDIWIPAQEAVIERNGKARALLYMDADFKGWELKAMWQDAKFGLRHRKDFSKLAVVGGPDWARWGVKLGELLMDCEVRLYEPERLGEAMTWATAP
ncbi:STAS/SEC14 domain-containing protein [Pseudodesulfovibrio indicus]|uniref:STAS/SEC14 domain-containing protein n=1 Tax=Pseudodesulfovibrio indicus TaxID=1716143 RepID=UPI00292DE2B7|nr:STAS/SEC14 domain-containing protein [Pseudodesulfovibrio indicus]